MPLAKADALEVEYQRQFRMIAGPYIDTVKDTRKAKGGWRRWKGSGVAEEGRKELLMTM